jgi:adenine-specific DNA-methyltransferase
MQLNSEAGTNRRFILIEQSRPERGDAYARTLLAERLRRVVTGDWAIGPQKPVAGGFTFKSSTTKVDRDAVLSMQREEMVDLILMSHWEASTRKGPMLTTLVHKGLRYLVARDVVGRGYFLVWDGPSAKSALTAASLTDIIAEAQAEGLASPYHVYARKSYVLTPSVIFYQIPDEILRRIGFNDAFAAGDEE